MRLLKQIQIYRKRADEIKSYLDHHPDEWSKYQEQFNLAIDSFYKGMMQFEIAHSNNKQRVNRLKSLFQRRLHKHFLYGDFIMWSLKKPFGYAGDYKIIDDIYRNNPVTTGFARLFDNYFQQASAPQAVRQRKENIKKILSTIIQLRSGKILRILDIGCGPCRIEKEFCKEFPDLAARVSFDCLDQDKKGLEYAQTILNGTTRVRFLEMNILRMALKSRMYEQMGEYDVIFASGLFDYFNHRLAVRIIKNLKSILALDGMLFFVNFGERYENPSLHFMEWVADWSVIHRTEPECERIFCEVGFTQDQVLVKKGSNNVLVYSFASRDVNIIETLKNFDLNYFVDFDKVSVPLVRR